MLQVKGAQVIAVGKRVFAAIQKVIGLRIEEALQSAIIIIDYRLPRGKTNEKGYVRGFDVRTGKRLARNGHRWRPLTAASSC